MSEKRSIVVDYDLPDPPRKVWRALTEPELLARWLMKNDIKPVVGHRFRMQAQPVGGWDGIVECEVLEVEVERRLVYSWQGGKDMPGGYGSRIDTVVTWSLSPTAEGGTQLRLEHAGFRDKDAFAYENMGKGWRGKVGDGIRKTIAELP